MLVGWMESANDEHTKARHLVQLQLQFKQAFVAEIVFGKLTIIIGLVILFMENASSCTRGKAVFPTICFFFGLVWLVTACTYYARYKQLTQQAPDGGLAAQDHLGNAPGGIPVAEVVDGVAAAPTGRVVEYGQPAALTVV